MMDRPPPLTLSMIAALYKITFSKPNRAYYVTAGGGILSVAEPCACCSDIDVIFTLQNVKRHFTTIGSSEERCKLLTKKVTQ